MRLVAKQGSTPLSGTSYAAPVVSGLAALVRSRFPTWTARQVMQRIKATAHHPAGGSDPRVGAGVVDFLAAVSTDSPTAQAPSATPTSAPVAEPATPPAPDHQRTPYGFHRRRGLRRLAGGDPVRSRDYGHGYGERLPTAGTS